MVSIVPHINTLIVDIGTEYTRVGYAGDFTAKYMEHTDTLCEDAPKPVENSIISCPESFVAVLEKQINFHKVDSVIIIEHPSQPIDTKLQVLKIISEKGLCNSLLFIRGAVCEAFGHGKTSGLVINCSAGSMTASIVQNGSVVEYFKTNTGGIYQDEWIKTQSQCTDRNELYLLKEKFVTELFSEQSEVYAGERFGIDLIAEVNGLLDKAMELRRKFNFKKNTVNGYIIFSGGITRNPSFFKYCRDYIIKNYSDQVNECILADDKLEACFAGASIFGSNNFTRPLFITSADYFKYKERIFDIKALSAN